MKELPMNDTRTRWPALYVLCLATLMIVLDERAKAMGITGFVAAGGGAIGVLLGGVLTGLLNWHWIFLVNVPVGVLVCALALKWVPLDVHAAEHQRLDVAGAVTVTAALM